MTAIADNLVEDITARVARFYEAFPYPRYPLLAKPRWLDGYLATSGFAETIAHRRTPSGVPTNILLAGAGEIVSYVIRRWEPGYKTLFCVDLSARSLKRSRLRLLANRNPTRFVASDLDEFLDRQPALMFSHVDAYGMLHHMPNPSGTLERLARHLQPGSTMRLMVYNTPARRWLNELQRALAVLGIDPHNSAHRGIARRLLKQCALLSPAIASRLRQVGSMTLEHDVRFADTFLHPHELRLAPTQWLNMLEKAGFEAVGLFDRYAELDDLPNPLWQMPTAAQLEERAADGRYENNLEIYLRKPGKPLKPRPNASAAWEDIGGKAERLRCAMLSLFGAQQAPRLWFAFSETKAAPRDLRVSVWRAYLKTMITRYPEPPDINMRPENLALWQRLARLGAVLPVQIRAESQQDQLLTPMTAAMKAPEAIKGIDFAGTTVERDVRAWLQKQGRLTERRVQAVLMRLKRAQ